MDLLECKSTVTEKMETDTGSTERGPAAYKPETVAMAIDRFLDNIVLYLCVQRDFNVSRFRIDQALCEAVYLQGLTSTQIYYTGSLFEGMPWAVCGDRDVMITKRIYPVVIHHPIPPLSGEGQVIVEANPHQPAYLQLRVPDGMTFQSDDTYQTVVDHNSSSYLSSSLFIKHLAKRAEEIHGPATTNVAFPQSPELGMRDNVPCLCCPTWPSCAQDFISRPRCHGWPSESLLNRIQQAGCHIVGIGHLSTDRRDLEWRWSFSVAERELIQHMSTAMAGSMFVLKGIKKHTWHEESTSDQPQAICSYYFKVACLWVAESSITESIMATTRKVLDWLIQCYHNHKIPHYFIPEQNLIGHLAHEICSEMENTLRELKSQLWFKFLCSLEKDIRLDAVIRSIQLQLDSTSVDQPTSNDYSKLLTTLHGCDQETMIRVLKGATDQLGPGGQIYTQEEHYWVGSRVRAEYAAILDRLVERINLTSPPELILIPDQIVFSVMDKVTSEINSKHVDLFRSSLHRYLAGIYHNLYNYYRDKNNHSTVQSQLADVIHECYQKAEKYYSEGIHLPYPDGWPDYALSGYVHLATFYILNEEWDKLEGVMVHLQPLLEGLNGLQSPEILREMTQIVIDTSYDLCKLPWRGDRLLYCPLVERCPDVGVRINPAVLGYYIQGRLSLRQGRREQAEKCVRYMEQARKVSLSAMLTTSTKVLIEVLKKYLTENVQ